MWFQSIADLWSAGRAGGEPEAKHLGGYIIGADLSPDGQTLATWSVTGEIREVGSVWIASPPEAELREYEPAPFRVEGAFEPDYIKFSPDGTQLLVSIQGHEGVEVWLLPYPDGGAARDRPKRVFADVKWTNPPQISWMPDGRRVAMAFAPTKKTGRQLWVADLRTERLMPLTAGLTEKTQPDVSPDGSTIVFSTSERDYNVVDVPLDGSSVRTLLATGQNEYSPAWIPGQDRFLYVTDRSGHDEIRLRSNTDGWDRAVVTQDDFPGDETRFLAASVASPNGERVAFWRWPGEGPSSIWLSPIDGGTPVKLVESDEGQSAPDWSPDGKWVSFIWNKGGTYTIAKSRVGASDPPQLLTDRCVFAAVIPVWSPTGEWIAYYCYDEPDEGVRLVSQDGGRTRRLARVGRPNGFVWSQDGATLFALRYSPGDPSLLAIDVATSDVTVVAEYTSDFTFASKWSPSVRYALAADGQSFSASIRRLQMDLWLLEGFDSRWSWRDWLR